MLLIAALALVWNLLGHLRATLLPLDLSNGGF
jgi:hypothetical protein